MSGTEFDAARDVMARFLGFGGVLLGAGCILRHAIFGAG